MTKNNLLRLIAESGYNVGYGAKKHLATYDMVIKMPGWIAFISLAVGIYSLFTPALNQPWITAAFICISIGTIFISFYSEGKDKYEEVGSKLTTKYHELRFLYQDVKSQPDGAELESFLNELKQIQIYVQDINIKKQIFLSDWYAHYKFFWQSQIGWMDEQIKFRPIRDKFPLGLILLVILIIGAILFHTSNYLIEYLQICF